jgi:hypothetical protein
MARTKKTPEELAAARAERKRVDEENRQKNLLKEQKEQADFEKNRPSMVLNLLATANHMRFIAFQAGAPLIGDYNWSEKDSIDFDSLDIFYYLWGDFNNICFSKLMYVYTKKDFEKFEHDFEQLKIILEQMLESKRAAEAEAARVREIRNTAISKLTDEEKKVLGVC